MMSRRRCGSHSRSLSVAEAKPLRGLGNNSRLALLGALRAGEQTVSDLVQATGPAQPNASGHLACLPDCGLVTSRQEGRYHFYALADPRVEGVIRDAEGIVADVVARVSTCSRYES